MKLSFRHIFILTGVWMAAAILIILPAAAQNRQDRHDLFTVYSVPVDVSARTATLARTRAIAEVQRAALSRLFTKLSNWNESLRIRPQSDGEISLLVRGIEVVEERLSARRYSGEFNISFDPTGIRRLFMAAGVPYTETPSRPTLVIPVVEEAGTYRLWTGENRWGRAWRAANPRDRLIGYRFADGGIRDRLLLTADQALRGDTEKLRKIADQYGADDVVVAVVKRLSDDMDGRDRIAFRYRFGLVPGSFTEGVMRSQDDDGDQALLIRVAKAIMRRADLAWKAQTLLMTQQTSHLEAHILAHTANEWAQIEQKLEHIPIIQEIMIKRMTVPLIDVAIEHLGSREQLSLALSLADITLEETDGHWLLKTVGKETDY